METKSYTGKKVTTRTAAGPISGCPVAAANFQCPYLKEGSNRVVVLDDPPYDVLLGRVPGTSPFEEVGQNKVTQTVLPKKLTSCIQNETGIDPTPSDVSKTAVPLEEQPESSKVPEPSPIVQESISTPSVTAPQCSPSIISQAAPVNGTLEPQGSQTVTSTTPTMSYSAPLCSTTRTFVPTNIGWTGNSQPTLKGPTILPRSPPWSTNPSFVMQGPSPPPPLPVPLTSPYIAVPVLPQMLTPIRGHPPLLSHSMQTGIFTAWHPWNIIKGTDSHLPDLLSRNH